jgi:RNA polymerase sigma factor (sigma-70 family)
MQETKTDGRDTPPASIESLYAAQESALLIYAQKLVNQTETAQDIVQEAFLKLHEGFDTVRQPQAWLYRTVHNLAINHLRKNNKIVPLVIDDSGKNDKPGPAQHPIDVADTKPLPDEYLARMEAIGRTRICLATLDARSRELIRLKFDEGLSYKEIAGQTHLTISNVGYLLHHALKAVAAALRKEQP